MNLLIRPTAQFASFASLLLAMSILPIKQSLSQQDGTNSNDDVFQIAAREQELRRKEEELLKAMRGSNTSLPESPQPDAVPSDSGKPSVEIVVAEANQASASEPISQQEVITNDHSSELRALEQHPALVEKKQAPNQSRAPERSSIKTYSTGTGNDGTTARRLGVYTRIRQDGYGSQAHNSRAAHSHTVSLIDIEREASVRSVSLGAPEVATTQGNATPLRTGPSRLDTNVLRLPPYSEVAVDYRSGNWYRVQTTRGVRGWVPGKSLLFDAGISPRSAVRVGAVTSSVR